MKKRTLASASYLARSTNTTDLDDPGSRLPPRQRGRRAGQAAGFHLHAGVSVPASNRLGREILLRYCARPPLSLERLSVLPDGRIAYRIKKPPLLNPPLDSAFALPPTFA